MSFLKIPFIIDLFRIKDIDGYQNLQKRINFKKVFLTNILEYLKFFENCLKDFSERVQNTNINLINMKFEPEEKNVHDIVKLICFNIQKDLEINSILLKEIIKHLSKHKDILIKELIFYDELKKTNEYIQEEKEKLNKNKEIFHTLVRQVENEIKNFVNNNPNLKDIYENEIIKNDLLKIIASPRNAFKDYKRSLDKTNHLIKIYNSKQLSLFKYFPDIINEEELSNSRLIKTYLENLEKQKENINIDITTIQNNNSLDINKKLMKLIEESEKNKQEEKLLQLVQHQTELIFNKCKNDKEFEICSKSINIIKTFISKDLFPKYDYELEYKNYRMDKIIKKLFKEKEEINPELAENLKNLIKDPSVYKGFLIILSHLRAKNQFMQTKYLIDLLGKEFNIIAEYSVKNKIYDIFENCIIISQTYYYEDENKNKIYILEYFKNNKYVKNTKFWRDFINNMIKEDFNRLETLNDFYINVEKNINITQSIKEKLKEIVFSQLVTYSNNMKEFEIDKRIILKIIEEFIEKYNYLSKDYIDTLYTMILEGEKDIGKIRKEYNPSLEDELNEEKGKNIEEKPKEDFNKDSNEKEKRKKNEIKDNNEVESNIKGYIQNKQNVNNNDNVKMNDNNFDNENQHENNENQKEEKENEKNGNTFFNEKKNENNDKEE